MTPTPSLRRDLNMGNTWLLPEWSTGPKGDERAVLEAAKAAGYQGIQGATPSVCLELGLVPVTFDIRIVPGGLVDRAKQWVDQGIVCSTLMVGTGMESDDEMSRLTEEILEASVVSGIPLLIETHRATMTQDIWRTLRLVERFPEIRFNGDFSHWYTGHDMPVGDMTEKIEQLSPVMERVRYMHGRIGTGGCVQIDVGDGRSDVAPISDFRAMWTKAFAGFIQNAASDQVRISDLQIGFAPELLPADFGYARKFPNGSGAPEEESDRWEQAFVLTRIAEECFETAIVGD